MISDRGSICKGGSSVQSERHDSKNSKQHEFAEESPNAEEAGTEALDTSSEDEEAINRQEETTTKDPEKLHRQRVGWFYGLILAAFVIVPIIIWGLSVAEPAKPLQIVAILERPTKTNDDGSISDEPGLAWKVKGRVLDGGEEVNGATVWATIEDEHRLRYQLESVKTTNDGAFVIPIRNEQVPSLSSDWEATIAVTAVADTGWLGQEETGREVLSTYAAPRSMDTMLSLSLVLLWLFLFSIVFALFSPKRKGWARHSYRMALVFALLSSVGIIMALMYVSGVLFVDSPEDANTSNGITRLGFLYVYEGQFDHRLSPEMVLSLSPPDRLAKSAVPSATLPEGATGDVSPKRAPAPDSNFDEHARGFGAPVWVVLLSVIGAAILPVIIILRDIGEPPDYDANDRSRILKRFENVVTHQCFIFFAPLGAIFLYQILLVSDAVGQPVTVGLAALGAGATMKVVVEKAVLFARNLARGDYRTEEKGKPNTEEPKKRIDEEDESN